MKKFENFCSALGNLEVGLNLPEPLNIAEETGLIAMFEICFEQTWKVLKAVLENEGYREAKTGSPRQILPKIGEKPPALAVGMNSKK
ncbi:MAG: nucleotidyltransferase substrate binding protein [Selenomonadaceae bacterium]|nr:nucleotidyltransferase substrate binding protein [Selenomonadaceae bacterium]